MSLPAVCGIVDAKATYFARVVLEDSFTSKTQLSLITAIDGDYIRTMYFYSFPKVARNLFFVSSDSLRQPEFTTLWLSSRLFYLMRQASKV